jgi:hypothetical protein
MSKKVGGEVMSNIITSRIIEKEVKELLEVLKRQRGRYIDRMIENLARLSEDPLDELEHILKELRRIESSVDKILHGFPLVNALIGSWFFAVIAEAESLVLELYDEFRYDDDFLRRNGRKRWKNRV